MEARKLTLRILSSVVRQDIAELQMLLSLPVEARVEPQTLERERDIIERVKGRMWLHVCPIVTLARSRTNLPAKFRVFVHSMALLSSCPD